MISAEPAPNRDDLSEAQSTWDSIDIAQVRDVAWTAIPYFMQRNLARLGAPDPHARVRAVLTTRASVGRRRELVGGVLLCGDMTGEAPLFRADETLAFKAVDGFDISPASLERADTRADAQGIPFHGRVADCNTLELDAGRYDLLVGHHGIHHVMNLAGLFAQARKGLRPEGLLVIDEWIGPAFLQIPRRNAFFARLLLFGLYPKRRSRTNHMGQVKGRWLQLPPEAFDPSEACNAESLLPEYHRNFQPIAEVAYGGLTYPVFEGLAHTIDTSRWTNWLRIRIVWWVERILTSLGLVRPLFVSSFGAPRPLDAREGAPQ